MKYQELIKQTENFNQQDFLGYIYKLQEIAKKKYSLNFYFQNYSQIEKNTSLKRESKTTQILEEESNKYNKKERKLGFLEGVEYYISEDFNDPIDDFKDYM